MMQTEDSAPKSPEKQPGAESKRMMIDRRMSGGSNQINGVYRKKTGESFGQPRDHREEGNDAIG